MFKPDEIVRVSNWIEFVVVELNNVVVVEEVFWLEIKDRWIRFLIAFFYLNLQIKSHLFDSIVHIGSVKFIRHNGSCAASPLEQASDMAS